MAQKVDKNITDFKVEIDSLDINAGQSFPDVNLTNLFTAEQIDILNQKDAFRAAPPPVPNPPTPRPATTNTTPTAPAPVPAPPPPPQPAPTTPSANALSGSRPIPVRPERYRLEAGSWKVTAAEQIKPLVYTFGERPVEMIEVLKVKGVIVKLTYENKTWHLISSQTLADITKSGNPHYDVAVNGNEMGVDLGKTVKIMSIDGNRLKKLIEERALLNNKAGVRDVIYINETDELLGGIPRGWVDQINYTLDKGTERTADVFEVYDINLKADYNIQPITIATKQTNGKLDSAKLKTFLEAVKARQKDLLADFNKIKLTFYGTASQYRETWTRYSQVATGQEKDFEDRTVIVKDTDLVKTEKTTTQEAQDKTDKQVEDNKAAAEDTSQYAYLSDMRKVMMKWESYGWTTEEAERLKNPQYAGNNPIRLTPQLPVINIAMLWTQGICDKAKVIGYMAINPPADTTRDSTVAKLREYYGILPGNELFSPSGTKIEDWREYVKANEKRKAELLYIARLVRDMEKTNSTSDVVGTNPGPRGGGGGGNRTTAASGQTLNQRDSGNAADRGRSQFE